MKRATWGWLLLGLAVTLLLTASLTMPRAPSGLIDVTQLERAVQGGQIRSLILTPQDNTVALTGRYSDGTSFQSRALASDPLLNLSTLRARGVDVTLAQVSRVNWLGVTSTTLTVLLILALLYLLLRQGRAAPENPANSFGRSRATVVREGQVKLTFADVAGCDEAKTDLTEVVDFLRHPERYHQLGARIPHGLLLVGPPGSGKTLLAKAVAGEAGVPYFSISGSDFVEMFVGVGAARVRDLFEQAKKQTPCIVFIDEIDAVGRKRGTGLNGGNDEREQTLNQLLVEMDGFGTTHDVIVLAATNRPDVLDAALLRPGRFDRQVVVDAPDVRGREMILKIHARKKPLDPTVDLALVARRTPGMVGADLENLLNEAALQAARNGRKRITTPDVEHARDRVLMGPERKSRVIAANDKRLTAYHEVGHALVAHLLPHADPLHKLTIVPRGRALGFAAYTPKDRLHHTRAALTDRLCVALAGQAAEQLAYGTITTGAQSDLQQATGIARRMITEWGMSDTLGHAALAQEHESYLGGMTSALNVSEHTAQRIDAEVRDLLDGQFERALALLTEHAHTLHRLTDTLITRETLSAEEFQTVVDGGTLPDLERSDDAAQGGPPALGKLSPGGA
ncbi:ATP-dependent zinc metalloprotease FtsH [Deinococcus maricopensis]|uniref:ATP-dependent zinc metalloprotease FtsH n=1 Tax=Deinococcus maricopensis (strain DSM 21211 / LMG 22137 / NRRL B-23946 / LB-34) TaxID=709986 RepID=E8UAS7_DEIML|nr:ATP-dependent zinc metalloprotease FtsH [Deinococcus maricopensis]ADV68166.1 ATP-dependent metalloprotease FtsH [Deinococcus maricopensis DSM 21211]